MPATEGPVSFKEFARLSLVGLQKGSSLRAFIEKRAVEHELELSTRVDVLSFDGARRMVEAGLGIAILPLGAIEPYLTAPNLLMAAFAEALADRSLKVAVSEATSLSRPVRFGAAFGQRVSRNHIDPASGLAMGACAFDQWSLIQNLLRFNPI